MNTDVNILFLSTSIVGKDDSRVEEDTIGEGTSGIVVAVEGISDTCEGNISCVIATDVGGSDLKANTIELSPGLEMLSTSF